MNKGAVIGFIFLAGFSATALAVTVPHTFVAGSPAVASDVNENFAALATAITALETANSATITAADVAGTYKMLTLGVKTESNSADLSFGTSNSIAESTVTFTATGSTGGTLSFTGNNKSSGFSGKSTHCESGTAQTGASGPSTSGASGTHSHTYLQATCSAGGFVNTNASVSEADSGTGTWVLGSGGAITITIPGEPASLTAYFSKGGRVAYAAEDTDESEASSTGRKSSMNIFVKQ